MTVLKLRKRDAAYTVCMRNDLCHSVSADHADFMEFSN